MMKRLSVLLAAMILLIASSACAYDATAWYYASLYTPLEIDQMYRECYDFLSWKQTFSSGYGMSAEYREEARFDRHDYYFGVVGNGECVAEISFSGWFSDMKMTDGMFSDGLFAYYAFATTAARAVPEGDELEGIISGYDIWDVMSNGRPYTYSAGGWTVTAASREALEIVHTSGAYALITVRDGRISAVIDPV